MWLLLIKGFFFLWMRDLEQLKVRGGVRRVQCLVPLTSREKDTQRPADFLKSGLGLSLLQLLTRGNVSFLPQDIILQHYFYFIDLTWSSTEWDRKLHLKDKWKKKI